MHLVDSNRMAFKIPLLPGEQEVLFVTLHIDQAFENRMSLFVSGLMIEMVFKFSSMTFHLLKRSGVLFRS